MASLLELNVKDAPKLIAVPEGEYQLQIEKAEIKASKSSNKQTLYAYFVIPAERASKSVMHTIGLELEDGLTQKQVDDAQRRLADFLECFNLDQSALNGLVQTPPDSSRLIGATGYAMLKIEEFEGRENNKVKYFITGA